MGRETLYAAGYLGLCPILHDALRKSETFKVTTEGCARDQHLRNQHLQLCTTSQPFLTAAGALCVCAQDSPGGAMAIAGVVGGVFAASASHPFDTIKTRMQV
jgi:hypothetical protein